MDFPILNNQHKRDSNIELLRIISMFMILNLHCFTSEDFLVKNDYFTTIDFCREAICIPAVNLYVLISGYYKIRWKVKSLLKFVFQVYFWVIAVHFVYCWFFGGTTSHIWNYLNCLSNSYWFVSAYLLLYLLSPLLNIFSEKATNLQFNAFLISFFVTQFYFCANGEQTFGRGYGVLSFIGLYLLGAKVKMIGKNVMIPILVLLIIMTVILIVLKMYLLKDTFGFTILQIKQSFWGLAYNNTLVVFLSLLIFLLFLQLKINSTLINNISKTIFAVYLLHMHPDLKAHFINYTHIRLYELPHIIHYVYIITIAGGTFFIAFVFDTLRIKVFDSLYFLCSKLCISKK